jgi:hypothetical protein
MVAGRVAALLATVKAITRASAHRILKVEFLN